MQALIAKVSERNVKTEAYFLMSVSIKKNKEHDDDDFVDELLYSEMYSIELKGQTHGLIRFAVSSSDMIRL